MKAILGIFMALFLAIATSAFADNEHMSSDKWDLGPFYNDISGGNNTGAHNADGGTSVPSGLSGGDAVKPEHPAAVDKAGNARDVNSNHWDVPVFGEASD